MLVAHDVLYVCVAVAVTIFVCVDILIESVFAPQSELTEVCVLAHEPLLVSESAVTVSSCSIPVTPITTSPFVIVPVVIVPLVPAPEVVPPVT